MHLQQRVHWELIHPKDSLYQLVNRGTRTAFGTEYHLSSGVTEIWDSPTQRDPRVVLGGGSFEFVGSIPIGASNRHVVVTWYDNDRLSGTKREWRADLPH